MKRTIAGFVATGMLTVALAAPAAAQARGYVGFGAGLSLPTGDFGDGVKTGWLGQVIAGITGPSGMLGGRIDGMYVRHSWEGTADGSTTLFGANADLVVSPGSGASKVRPYLLGGVGFFNGKDKVAGVSSDGETKFAFNVGGGLQVKAGSRMHVFLEGRYISVRTENAIGFIPISVGLRWGGN
jgi:opacity protein-like surface antigen